MNGRRSSSANAAIGDPSDGDHFCEGGERADGHRAKPDITRHSVDSSSFLSFPVVGSNATNAMSAEMKNELVLETARAFGVFFGKGARAQNRGKGQSKSMRQPHTEEVY